VGPLPRQDPRAAALHVSPPLTRSKPIQSAFIAVATTCWRGSSGLVGPPDRQALEDASQHDPDHFQAGVRTRLVSTFSVWRSAAEMRDYANRGGGAHRHAVARDRAHPFHRHSAFIRFRPLASAGSWEGPDPLAVTSATGS
jgi:hypothetical protein